MDISIHALREEGDPCSTSKQGSPMKFLSTPSARRATVHFCPENVFLRISIHALREEGDSWRLNPKTAGERFLSTPSARRATYNLELMKKEQTFLSTPSARRATSRGSTSPATRPDFYPRPPRGGRLTRISAKVKSVRFLSTPSARRATLQSRADEKGAGISIHALREEGDTWQDT